MADRSSIVALVCALTMTTGPGQPPARGAGDLQLVRPEPAANVQGPPFRPIPESALLSRASIAPIPPHAPGTFRRRAYVIRSLPWSALPRNGDRLRSLKNHPNSDRNGIPYEIVNGRRYYSPGRMGLQGVRFLDGYVRTGNPAYLKRAVARADALIRLSRNVRGALYFRYTRSWPREGLRPPWYSAHAQGQALSLFVRLYRVTGDITYLRTARAVFLSLRRLGPSSQPWVSHVPRGFLWHEEYPATPPTHVLNGHIHALLGVYEFERLTRDPAARQLLEAAITTVREYARRYRVPGGLSYYDQVHFTRWSHYHALHIAQLRLLYRITRDSYFLRLANAFASDA